MPDSRRLPRGSTPEQVLAVELGRVSKRLDDIRSTVIGRARGDSAWTPVTFTNGWGNNFPSQTPGSYRKDGSGFVHLRGTITGGTNGVAAFILPADYRPALTCYFPAVANGTFGWVIVTDVGEVVPNGSTAWFSIDGITFLAE